MCAPRRVAAAVLGALAAATLGVACSGGGIDLPVAPTSTGFLQPTSTSTTTPTVGEPLVIAEQGVTSFADPYEKGQTLGGYGVVLMNPNVGLLAAGVQVTTSILGVDGATLLVDHALLNGIMPGQRMAVGRTLIEPIPKPTSLDIKVDVAGWLPPAATGTLTTQEAITSPEPFGGAATRFAVKSDWPTDEEGVDVAAVYRDKDGHILSVEGTTLDSLPTGAVVVGTIRLLAPIPGLASTEVLVGRGFAAQTTG